MDHTSSWLTSGTLGLREASNEACGKTIVEAHSGRSRSDTTCSRRVVGLLKGRLNLMVHELGKCIGQVYISGGSLNFDGVNVQPLDCVSAHVG